MLWGGVAACQGMIRVPFAIALNTANSTHTIT